MPWALRRKRGSGPPSPQVRRVHRSHRNRRSFRNPRAHRNPRLLRVVSITGKEIAQLVRGAISQVMGVPRLVPGYRAARKAGAIGVR